MRILSKTSANGRVVELTAEEWREFIILAAAIEGKDSDALYFDFHTKYRNTIAATSDVDFSGVFGAVLAFYQAKFRANDLRVLVDTFDTYLGGQQPKKSE